ncbi:hypothetical protein [Cellulomonas sp. URHB0016]
MNAPWWRLAPTQKYVPTSTRPDTLRTSPDELETDLLPPFMD